MKIKYKAPLIMFMCTLVMTSVSAYVGYRSNLKLINSGMEMELHTVSTILQNDIQIKASNAAARASLVANFPPVQEALKAHDRDQLIKLVVPAFLIQKEKFGVVDGHFHYPPAVSFLRTFALQKWGDDLSTSRELVLQANKKLTPLQGIEISTTGVSIKGIDIVKDENGPIGSLEVGVGFNSLLQELQDNTGFDSAAFIDENMLTKIATAAPKGDPDRIIGGFRTWATTDWAKIHAVVNPEILNKVTDLTYKIETINGQFVGVVLVPLLDFRGVQIGSIVAVKNFDNYQRQLLGNLLTSIALALLQIIIIVGLNFIIFNVWLVSNDAPVESVPVKKE